MLNLLTKGKKSQTVLEAIFRATRDAIIILENGVIAECNAATVALFGAKNMEALLGKSVMFISPEKQNNGEDSAKAAEAHIGKCFEQGENFFEWTHRKLNGELFEAEVLLCKIDLEEKVIIQAVVRDVSARKEISNQNQQLIEELRAGEEELRQNLEELQTQRDYIEKMSEEIKLKNQILERNSKVLLNLNKSPEVHSGHLEKAFELISQQAAQLLQITRVSIWDYQPENQQIVCRKQYDQGGAQLFSEGAVIRQTDAPTYFEDVLTEKVMIAANAKQHPALVEFIDSYLEPLQIYSLLDVPFFVDGQMAGVICCEHQKEHKYWTLEEVAFVKSLADIITIATKTQQQLAQQELLRQNERRLFNFLDKIPAGIFILENTGVPYFANTKAKEMLGKGIMPDTQGKSLAEVYQAKLEGSEEDYPQSEMPLVKALGGITSTVENMEILREGQRIPLEVTGSPVVNDQGEVEYAIAIFQDISDRKAKENAIAKTQRKLEANEAILKKAFEKTKLQEKEIREQHEELLASEEELRQNMEELQAIQEEIAQKQRQIEGFINASSDNIFMLDSQYNIVLVNQKVIDEYAASGVEVKPGINLLHLVEPHKQEEQKEQLARVFAGESFTIETKYEFEGMEGYYELNYFPVKNTDNKVQFVGISTRNITERKMQEAAIIKTNKKLEANEAILKKAFEKTKLQEQEIRQKHEELQASEEELRQNMEELQATQEVLAQQKEILEINNKQMTKSINYAKTIQNAILPSEKQQKNAFPESFILYRPKDIVSGDFYWVSAHEQNQRLAGVIDCTGHGVPGAFMSMVGNNILNEIINQRGVRQPNIILNELHFGIRAKLNQKEGANNDGMDLSFCLLESERNGQQKLTFAGAKRSLYIVRKGDLIELKGDRLSVGGSQTADERNYQNHELLLEEGDTIFLITDGYADQADLQRRSFSNKRLRELMLQAAPLSIEAQKALFEHSLEAHQQAAEQRDDITVFAFKI
jgi:PAS domain S-box-containing protein